MKPINIFTARLGKGKTIRRLEEMGKTIELERRVFELEQKLDSLYDYVTETMILSEANKQAHDVQ